MTAELGGLPMWWVVMLKVMCLGVKLMGMIVMIDRDHQLQPHLRDRSPGHACGNCLE